MASPFSVFRKNQKLMLAVLTILAMVGFVFLPIFMDYMGGTKVQNPVAVKTSAFGDLHERDLRVLLDEHRRTVATLAEVMQTAGASQRYATGMVEANFGSPTMENVVNNWLLAQQAQQMGMVISDQTINSWLKMITQDTVNHANFQAIFKHHGFSEYQFFRVMRDELAAWQLKNMFDVSLVALTPAQRWEYFCRVKQLATIEAVPVPVANYLKRVDEPNDETLKTFFEQNKERYATPDSPEPGFREPQRVALQYLKANLDKVAAGITEEEVKAHYEKNKQRYDEAEKKLESKKAELPSLTSPETKQPEAKKTPEPSTKGMPDVKKETKPAEKQPAAKETKEVKPAAPAPQPEKAKQPEPSKQPAQPEKDKKPKGTSAIEQPSPFRLAALMKDEKQPAGGPGPASATSPPAKPEPPAKNPADKPTPPKPSHAPAPAKPEAKPAPSATGPVTATPPAAKPAAPSATGSANATPPQPAGPSDAIKRRVRQELAWEKISKVFESLRNKMDEYRRQRSAYDVAMIQRHNKKEEGTALGPLPPLPPPLDFEKLAQQNGLTAGKTALMAQWEIQSTEIGTSFVGMRDPVARYALTLARFHPAESMDLQGDRYVFWKTEETKDQVPEFNSKEREVVLRTWKMVQGRGLAVKGAEALADEARKANKPLKQVLADRPDLRVVMPSPFSWVTFGNVALGSAPNAARISSVAGVDMAGNDFMRAVFHLEPGQIGVALNAPQTVAYVIRLESFSPSHEVLWKQFEVDDFSKYAPAALTDQRQIHHAWMDEIKTSAGLQWKQKQEQQEQGSGPQEQEEE